MGLLETVGLAAGISAVGGIASSIGSNASNKKIQQMNNEFNERMLNKQMDYNTSMYNRQLSDALQYSDPSFIRQRQEAAGYNSGVLAAGGNLGSAVSTPSAQGVNPPQSANRTADFSQIGESIAGAMNFLREAKLSRSQGNLLDTQAMNMRIESKYIAAKAVADLNETLSRTKNNEARTATENMLRSIRKDMVESETALNQEQAQNAAVARRGMIVENAMKSIQLKWLPAQIRMDLGNGAADIALKKAQKQLTDKQAEHEVQKLIQTVVNTNGKQLENQFNADTYNDRLKQVKEVLFNLIYDTDKLGFFKTGARALSNFGIPDNVH